MKLTSRSKKWIFHISLAIVITSLIGLNIPKALFVSGFIIALDFFKLSYSETDDRDFKSDLYYFLSMFFISGLSVVLLWRICNIAQNIKSCSSNDFRGMIFAIISFPIIMGLFLWVTTRLPKIFSIFFRK